MKRRFFLSGIGLTLLTLLKPRKASALDVLQSTGDRGAATSKPKLTRSDSDGFRARALMVFMLGATQQCDSKGCGTSYIHDLFPPAGGNVDFDKNFKRLGLEEEFLKNFIKTVPASKHDELRTKIQAVSDVFIGLFGYSKPDCPTPATLKTIVTAAKQ
jgi:hypothetical protein